MKNLFEDFPGWVNNAVVYQIFPDRFRRSGRVNAQRHLMFLPWRTDPVDQGFHGGDLYGVIEGLDHLQSLGVNCLYLTPIFCSAANHRYHTYDYLKVDPILGGNGALSELIEAIHKRSMRIILDGVFNHCGRGFWAFHHLVENGELSPYREWFHVHQWPLNPYPKNGEECGYSCWWNDPALPKFNHHHFDVRKYLIDVATFWVEMGIDGWRLDVPDEVPSDFWIEFRREIKAINSNAWILGEIWGDARQWLNGEHFDGVMNYRIGWSTLSWVGGKSLRSNYKNPLYPIENIDTKSFINILNMTMGWYSDQVNRCQLNLLDSHDVPRALNTLRGDLSALKLAFFVLFIQPGAPCIYYGTEVGLSGGAEPDCREDFPWDDYWDIDLANFICSLGEVRSQFPEITQRSLVWESIGDEGLVGWEMKEKSLISEKVSLKAIFINRSRTSSMCICSHFDQKLFEIGTFLDDTNKLAPQSAVLLSGVSKE